MNRIVIVAVALLLAAPRFAYADAFDYYTNDILVKVPRADGAEQLKELTPELLVEHTRVLPNIKAAFVVVKTNEGRFAKLLVQASGRKVGDKVLPTLLIERFVTYKEGEERTIAADGNNIHLFEDFQFSLDLGQIVPAAVGGDIRLIVAKDKTYVEPVGKAEIYLLTKPLAEAAPKHGEKVVVGTPFEAKYFSGTYKVFDDGRRTGKLVLKVAGDGFLDGWYYSDTDGAKYQVTGKVGEPNHTIKFKLLWPKTVQEFQGWMFTSDGRAICGVSRMLGSESAFYALRVEE